MVLCEYIFLYEREEKKAKKEKKGETRQTRDEFFFHKKHSLHILLE